MAKSWFFDAERHAEAARNGKTGLAGAQPKSEIHNSLKTALKIAAIGAVTVGGIAALSNPVIRGAIINTAKRVLGKLPSSKVAATAYKATLAEGGSTLSLAGETPAARYMFSPYKANEKIISAKNLTPHHIDSYIKENKVLGITLRLGKSTLMYRYLIRID
jgi:hypothetical protein